MQEVERRKVAIYVRVSTVFQVDKDSLPMQRKDLIAYSELILGIPDYVIFEDAGYSGKNTDRPAYQEMMNRIKAHEFSHLLVWKIDRISRDLIDFSEMYSELKTLRVIFVSKHEQFDTSTAMGEAMLKIILVFAELERKMTAERVTATMISRANQGIWNGGKVPYGYGYDEESQTFYIHESEAAVCRLIVEDYISHKSIIHTTKLLNSKGYRTRSGAEWSANAVWIIIQSPFYAGTYRYNHYKGSEHRTLNAENEWILYENHHPAIFTQKEYEIMTSIREENKRKINTSEQDNIKSNIYVFGKICYCGKCGSNLVSTTGRLHSDGYRTSIYSCSKRRKSNTCDNPAVNDLVIGEFVINYISNIINAKKEFSTIPDIDSFRKKLLHGQMFKDVISVEGLNELYSLLSQFKSDNSFILLNKPRRKIEVDSEIAALKKERSKHERALSRLQDLYLYSDISEKDYIIQRTDILSKIDVINKKLGLKQSEDTTISDEEFIKKASHLLINSRLQNREYIYYKNLAASVSPDILQEYVRSIIDNIQLTDGHVTGITFKNGITNLFKYKGTDG